MSQVSSTAKATIPSVDINTLGVDSLKEHNSNSNLHSTSPTQFFSSPFVNGSADMEKGMHQPVPAHQISTYSSLAGALGHYAPFTHPPESLEPRIKKLTGQRLPILQECDEIQFVGRAQPVTVKAVLGGGLSSSELIWQDCEIVLRGASGRLIELRMLVSIRWYLSYSLWMNVAGTMEIPPIFCLI